MDGESWDYHEEYKNHVIAFADRFSPETRAQIQDNPFGLMTCMKESEVKIGDLLRGHLFDGRCSENEGRFHVAMSYWFNQMYRRSITDLYGVRFDFMMFIYNFKKEQEARLSVARKCLFNFFQFSNKILPKNIMTLIQHYLYKFDIYYVVNRRYKDGKIHLFTIFMNEHDLDLLIE